MGKYRERVLAGSEWVQLGKAKIVFSVDKPHKIVFNEILISTLDEKLDIQNRREIEVELLDPTTKFPIVDPSNNVPTGGDASYKQLERMVYSLYYQKAQELDALIPPVE